MFVWFQAKTEIETNETIQNKRYERVWIITTSNRSEFLNGSMEPKVQSGSKWWVFDQKWPILNCEPLDIELEMQNSMHS